MFVPAKTKYRKEQKGGKKLLGTSTDGSSIKFGSYALKALEPGLISSKQLESARKVISRYIKKSGKLWITVFPHTPRTKKPAEVRMGSGKGNVEYYVAKVKPGRVIFEIDGVSDVLAVELLTKAGAKLSVLTKVVGLVV